MTGAPETGNAARETMQDMTGPGPIPKDTSSAAERLFRRLEAQINAGELKDGDTLPPEREIVEIYGVSRTVAREAVKALANKGLVEARPRYRPVIRKPDVDTALETMGSVVGLLLKEPGGVRNLFDSRIMVEAALVRHAALHADADDIAALKSALDANRAVIDDSEEFYRSDTAFHAVLYNIPKNPVIRALHKAYTTWLAPQWSKMPRLPDRNQINFESHRAIFEAVVAHDPNAAEAALREHLDNAWAQVRETFGDI